MFEYMQLIRPGDNLLSVDFITRVALLIFSGLVLVAVGYKIKGMWGAVVAIVLGSLFFLFNQGILRIENFALQF
jgi:hypothetical protein